MFVLEPLRGHRSALPGGRQAQVVRLPLALQQLGDALRDSQCRERHELWQLQGTLESISNSMSAADHLYLFASKIFDFTFVKQFRM